MQFGGFPRVLQVGCVVVVSVLGASRVSAQISQVLGGTGGQQQQACNPTDPGCQQTVDQIRNPPQVNVQTTLPQGAVLDQTNQNTNANAQTGPSDASIRARPGSR